MSSSPWRIEVSQRLAEEFAQLSPGSRRAVHDLFAALAEDPRPPAGHAEPVHGAELRRVTTAPAAGTGEMITLLYRVHRDKPAVTVLFLVRGP